MTTSFITENEFSNHRQPPVGEKCSCWKNGNKSNGWKVNLKISPLISSNECHCCYFSPAPWNYMWKPGPYPINDEERAAAAKKYGMLLEDYKPNEDMDAMMGDYPNLPIEPQAEKNALYDWDCPEYRRNYGEPLQEEWWKYQEIRFSPMRRKNN